MGDRNPVSRTADRYMKKGVAVSMIPSDPIMLLSFVNMKLRDSYDSPEAMCDALDIDLKEVNEKLASVGYRYDKAVNQYK